VGNSKGRIWVYSFLTATAFVILYVFTAVLIIIGFPFAHLKQRKVVAFLMLFWARAGFAIIGKKLHIEGKENFRKDGKYLLVANHSSLFDIMAIVSFFPRVVWFGHARLLKIPFIRQALKMTNYVPMRRASIKNTKEMLDRLIETSHGHTIAIFPEGTRTKDGKINAFYRGFIQVLRASDINVLPVTLNGFFVLKPKNRFYINFSSSINVIIHKPLQRDTLIDKTDAEIIRIIKDIIESALIPLQEPDNLVFSNPITTTESNYESEQEVGLYS
jgi:1-acyl-sn-glycerol-3-phosphate acyltransferase